MSLNCSFQEPNERVDSVENSTIQDQIKLKHSGALIYEGSLEKLRVK